MAAASESSGIKSFWKFILKVQPVNEAEAAVLHFLFKFAGCPVASASSLHVRHGPDNLSRSSSNALGQRRM